MMAGSGVFDEVFDAAYELNGQRCSREVFYSVACEPSRCVVVQACAGAGKTWLLVSRIVRALLLGVEPREILAITFTKKAAGEMRERLNEWLRDFAVKRAGEDDSVYLERLAAELRLRGMNGDAAAEFAPRLSKLYPAMLFMGHEVQVKTFHSWFASLLRSAPLKVLSDLGLPSSYEMVEDDGDLLEEGWRAFLAFLAKGDCEENVLARDAFVRLVRGVGQSVAKGLIFDAMGKRVEFELADKVLAVESFVPSFDVYFPAMAGLSSPEDFLFKRAAGRQLLEVAAGNLLPAAPSFAQKGKQLLDGLASGDFALVQDALLTKDSSPRKFGSKIRDIDAVRAAQDEVIFVLKAMAQQRAHVFNRDMAVMLRVFIRVFSRLKQARGFVDMPDVERAAFVLLSDPVLSGWVQQRLDFSVRQLLVDEFQDTSPLQWQALCNWLSGYVGAGSSGIGVFVVGDPKQSIYRFRRADPRVFDSACNFVVNGLGGDFLACDHTRRNSRAVIDLVNVVMGQAQVAGEFDGFRLHTTELGADFSSDFAIGALPLIPRDELVKQNDDLISWRDTLTSPKVLPEEKLLQKECRQVAGFIRQRVGCGIAPEEIMVMSRRRDSLAALQVELESLGIACEQPEKRFLADMPAVKDVLYLLDCLISTSQNLSLAIALKSPIFGCSDEMLACIARKVKEVKDSKDAADAGDLPTWWEVIHELPAFFDVCVSLDRCRQWLKRLSPHDALELIYKELDIYAKFASCVDSNEAQNVLSQLRALLHSALSIGGGRFVNAYAWLRELRQKRLPAPRGKSKKAVSLLTVHGAKGLEAREVILLSSTKESKAKSGKPFVLMDWHGDSSEPQSFLFVESDSKPAPSWAEKMVAEHKAQAREEMNVLYVAMTRAKEKITLSGVTPRTASKDSWYERIGKYAASISVDTNENGIANIANNDDAKEAFILKELKELEKAAE